MGSGNASDLLRILIRWILAKSSGIEIYLLCLPQVLWLLSHGCGRDDSYWYDVCAQVDPPNAGPSIAGMVAFLFLGGCFDIYA